MVIFFGKEIHIQYYKLRIFMNGSLPFYQDSDYPALFAGLIRQKIQKNLANKQLFAGLIWQIVTYLPD